MGIIIPPSIVNAQELFSGLQSEDEQPKDKKYQVEMNQNLEEIVKKFEKILVYIGDIYEDSLELIKKSYSAKDIYEFSIILKNYEKEKGFDYVSGLYLSTLINDSNDNEFNIYTKHLDILPNYIGYKNNGKIITINGNVSDWLGDSMISGEIIVNGNANGLIGWGIYDGEIIINGNAGDCIGNIMTGGSIYLNGEYESISRIIWGGNIFHKGKQLIKDGKKVS
jgi:formylmethanofuran dehydrogenase subunit C